MAAAHEALEGARRSTEQEEVAFRALKASADRDRADLTARLADLAYLEQVCATLITERNNLDASCNELALQRSALDGRCKDLEAKLDTLARDRVSLEKALTAKVDALVLERDTLNTISNDIAVERNRVRQQLEFVAAERDALDILVTRHGLKPRIVDAQAGGREPLRAAKAEFEDEFPGAPRILFVGWPISSHTTSWIDLVRDCSINVRLFGLPAPGSLPPPDWPVRTYVAATDRSLRPDESRMSVFPPPQDSREYFGFLYETLLSGDRIPPGPARKILSDRSTRIARTAEHSLTIESALARVVRDWQPDLVHTLGVEDASYLFLHTRAAYHLDKVRWVVQARGGPDLDLNSHLPEHRDLIGNVLATCDHFIADNDLNYQRAIALGLDPRKATQPGLGVVSGAGGMDLKVLARGSELPPSRRPRVIVWPKAYETKTAKAMPVLEALVKSWDTISPCRVELLWCTQPEVLAWISKAVPAHIRRDWEIVGRVPREEALRRIGAARVLLAPSLLDGIPNAMLEAMATGTAPIVSPLDTIVPVVEADHNVIYARNLYPDEIAGALIRAMSDDALVDRMAEANRVRVSELSNREEIQVRVVTYYRDLLALGPPGR